MYKFTDETTIKRLSDSVFIPVSEGNRDYQLFKADVVGIGSTCVVGIDTVTTVDYSDARAAEYPPIVDQLDKIYHSGVDAWKADIKVIKDKYPKTQVGITSIAALPSWIDTVIFDRQKEEYVKAVARLAQYELSGGLYDPENGFVINPLPLWVDGERNPVVVQDETERDAAQTVINNTPQEVINSINN